MNIVLIFMLLLLKHNVADFVLQTPYQLHHKGQYLHWGGILHAAIHMLGTLVVLMFFISWQFALMASVFDGFVHYHVDWLKAKINTHYQLHPDNPHFWIIFGAD